MSEKRKDSKGRILKTGESQRKDGLYQYRYQDINGERRTVYAKSLNELREKEKEINKQLSNGVSLFEGNIELSGLLDKLFSIKNNWKDSTRQTMTRYRNIIAESRLYHTPINKIKMSDCKAYMVLLKNEGYAFGTIKPIHSILKMAFNLACEDDVLGRNPCNFKLGSVIEDDTLKVVALSEEQEESLLNYMRNDKLARRQYDTVQILLGTGMRIGEFAALTIDDIDFIENVIHVRKQIVRIAGGLVVTEPKTNNAVRDIPMTKDVSTSVRNLINKRNTIKTDVMVSGYVGFLSVTRNGRPRCGNEYADQIRQLIDRYNEASDLKIEHCTAHVFRHTFCTRCVAKGLDIKTIQYLMGHSNASTTLNIYTDPVFDNVVAGVKQLEKVAKK